MPPFRVPARGQEAGRGLNQWRAYVVIDYPALASDHAFMGRLPPGNLQAALIRLESASGDELPGLLAEAFQRWSGPESAGLRRGFHARAEHLLRRRGLALPPLADYERMFAQEKGAKEMTTLMEARLQEWHDNAIAQGQADLLHRLAKRRFDTETARRLSALLEGADADRLIDVGNWIVECANGDELLERVRQASGLA